MTLTETNNRKHFNNLLIIDISPVMKGLFLTATVKLLKEKFPNLKISVLTDNSDSLYNNEKIENIFTLNNDNIFTEIFSEIKRIKAHDFDVLCFIDAGFWIKNSLLFSFRKSNISIFNSISNKKFPSEKYESILKNFDIEVNANMLLQNLELLSDAKHLNNIKLLMNSLPLNNRLVLVCMDSFSGIKGWPVDFYFDVCSKLLLNKITVLLIGFDFKLADDFMWKLVKSDNEYRDYIKNTASCLSLQEMCHLISISDLLITNENECFYLSYCRKRPCMVFAGPDFLLNAEYNDSDNVFIHNADLKCKPCKDILKNNCPEKHFKCMTGYNPGYVFLEILRFFEKRKF